MPNFDDIVDPVSTAELERRWKALRHAMGERGIDVLLAQGNNSSYGGYVKWMTDLPSLAGIYISVLFPKDEAMVMVRHGPHKESKIAASDPIYRGIGKLVTRPGFTSANFTESYYADATVEELRRLGARTIGIVNGQTISYAFLDRIIKAGFPGVSFVDATDLVDEIKAIKSDEEIALIRRCAAMQDAALDAVVKEVRPGRRVNDIVAVAQYVGATLGSFDGLFLAGSGPLGKPAPKGPRPFWNRELRDGDQFTILIENNGPNGQFCEIGRTCVIGEAPQYMKDELAFVLKAQDFTLDMIRPGAAPADILARYNAFMRENGRPEEDRLYAHGQGYDLVERPLFMAEETMTLKAGMNLAVHPTYLTDKEYAWICDNYLVTETGVSDCLHKTAKKIFEV
jgi:Xaa-Pro aminopeptidase